MEGERPDEARLLKRGALWAGVPLALSLALPWPYRGDWVWSWELARELDMPGLWLLPLLGVAVAGAALVPRLPPVVRATFVAVAGVASMWLLRDLLHHPESVRELPREVRRGSLFALDLLLAGWLLAPAAEVAMQRRRASRAWAAVAAVGWGFYLSRFFQPLLPERVESMPFLVLTEGIEELQREPAVIVLLGPLVGLLVLGLLQTVLALRGTLGGEEGRLRRRWRSAWVAVVVAGLPGVVALLLALLAAVAEEEAELAVMALHLGPLLFGPPVACVWGLGHAAVLWADAGRGVVSDLRSDDARRSGRARLVLGALAVAVVVALGGSVFRAIRPDPRDAELAELVHRVEEAVLAAGTGRPYDEMLHGGYPEIDIRASRGALLDHVHDGAPFEAVAFAFDLGGDVGDYFRGRVVVRGDEVRWASFAGAYADALSDLDPGIPALAGAVERVRDLVAGGSCVVPLTAESLSDIPPPVRERIGPLGDVAAGCAELSPEPPSLVDAPGTRGWIGPCVLIVRSGPRWLALHGTWHADSGRLWLGAFRIEVLTSAS